VVGVVDLDPRGIAKIAEAQRDVVLVDLGQTDPAAAAWMIKAVSGGTKLVPLHSTRLTTMSLPAPPPASAAMSRAKAARTNFTAPWWTQSKAACTARRTLQQRCAPALPAYCRADQQEPLPALSSRESEILALVEQGRSNKEIARQLAISSPPSRITYTAFYRDCRSADAAKPPPGCVSRTTAEPRFILQ